MVERIVTGPLSVNTYIYSEWKKECLIIDPGGDPDKIISHMTRKNLKPLGIICTHGHLDHIAAIPAILDHYLESDVRIPVAIHSKDKKFLGSRAREHHEANFSNLGPEAQALFQEMYQPLPAADVILEEGDNPFGSLLKVVHTPGHTNGSICLHHESYMTLISGDTLFFEGVGRTDLIGGSQNKLLKSITEKLYTLPPETTVFPGHGPFSTIEREMAHTPYT
mgnify:CR=1 FL=1